MSNKFKPEYPIIWESITNIVFKTIHHEGISQVNILNCYDVVFSKIDQIEKDKQEVVGTLIRLLTKDNTHYHQDMELIEKYTGKSIKELLKNVCNN